MLTNRIVIALLALVLVVPATAQTWSEVGDAGEFVATAQITMGAGPLTSITGLSDAATEDKDVFAIKILAGGGFSADVTSAKVIDGTFDDTKLYLFDSTGRGIIGDDDSSANGGAADAGFPLGNSLINGLAEGIYYLAISDLDYIPTSDLGDIFPMGDLVGPTGPGGTDPQTGWSSSEHEDAWNYTITLTGAQFAVPEPSGMLFGTIAACFAWGVLRMRAARRAGRRRST